MTAMNPVSQARAVVPLGVTQTLAGASSYYLPAILAGPMSRDLGVSASTVFAAFSMALIISAIVGPWSGRLIDSYGGRPVLMGTSGLFAFGLATLSLVDGAPGLFAAWALLGLAMGSGLYEGAFAALVRLYGHGARNAITGVTLMAGFASTLGWPLSAWLEVQLGWRGACLVWAVVHVLLGLPLHACIPRSDSAVRPSPLPLAGAALSPMPPGSPPAWAPVALAFVFSATWFVSSAMAAHLPRLMEAAGVSFTVAVTVGTLLGPAQVVGRLLEIGFLRRVHPLVSARLAVLAHPTAALVLLAFGPLFAPLFALLHGVGTGILTIARGTLPLVLFGSQGYGARQGRLMLPARVTQALAPLAFSILLDWLQAGALWVTSGLALAAFTVLMALRTWRSC